MANIQEALNAALRSLKTKPIFQTKDEYGNIFVFEERGKRVLTFDERFEQSSMQLKSPARPAHSYTRAMLLALAFIKPEKALHLGLGGGALIRSLAKICPDCQQSAIELRPSVKLIAEQYFLAPDFFQPKHPVKIVCDNAKRYISGQKGANWDIIFSDIYLADGMDISQKSERYLADCAMALHDQGWLVINFTQLPRFDDPCFKKLQHDFGEILVASVDTANYIVLAGKQRLTRPLAAYAASACALSETLDVPLLKQFKHLVRYGDFYRLD